MLQKKHNTQIYILKSSNITKEKKENFLKYILKKYYNIYNYIIEYDKYNKPYLKNSEIFYNSSDTTNYIAIAISYNEVGIDIEEERIIDTIMIDKILDKTEQKNSINNNKLIEMWVGKEAYIKFKGTGIIKDFNNYNLDYLKKNNEYLEIHNEKLYLCCFSKNKINKRIIYIDKF